MSADALPEGWIRYVDASSGAPYYHNPVTQETTWNLPTGPHAADSAAGESPAVQMLLAATKPHLPTSTAGALCFNVGDRVKLHGLTSDVGMALNGKEGMVTAYINDDQEVARHPIQVADGTVKAVRGENLLLLNVPAATAPQVFAGVTLSRTAVPPTSSSASSPAWLAAPATVPQTRGQLHASMAASATASRDPVELDDPWADLADPPRAKAAAVGINQLNRFAPPGAEAAEPPKAGPSPWQNFQPSNRRAPSPPDRHHPEVTPPHRRAQSRPVLRGDRGDMMQTSQAHTPCLLNEAVEQLLAPHLMQPDGRFGGTFVDGTFGRGGHTREILQRLSSDARLFAFDVDPEAVLVAKELEKEDPRFSIIHRPFGDIAEIFQTGQLDGVLVDLGVSSPQLDERHRGFNCFDNCPLDMRMNPDQGMSAAEWLKTVSVEELAWVIHQYGEDHDINMAERIAETILAKQRQQNGHIYSCRNLSNIVRDAKGHICDAHMHPAKLTFQAIRIFLNCEMQQLDSLLHGALRRLKVGGRCVVISFKAKEADKIRKFVRDHEEPDNFLKGELSRERLCELYPLLRTDKDFAVKQIKEPIRATREEIERNNRSRSSAVHVLLKAKRNCEYCTNVSVRETGERFREPHLKPSFVGARDNSNPLGTRENCIPVSSSLGHVGSEQNAWATTSSSSSSHPGQGEASRTAATSTSSGCSNTRRAILVKDDYSNTIVQGYLTLKQGDVVEIQYEGDSGNPEEAGWLYGIVVNAEHAKRQGWFPATVIGESIFT